MQFWFILLYLCLCGTQRFPRWSRLLVYFSCYFVNFLLVICWFSEPSSRDLGTLITCLKTARSSGLMSFNKKSLENLTAKSSCLWCGVVPVELMRKALCHLDDQVTLIFVNLPIGFLIEELKMSQVSSNLWSKTLNSHAVSTYTLTVINLLHVRFSRQQPKCFYEQ